MTSDQQHEPVTDRVDNPADLVPTRNYVGAILTGIILLLVAVLLIVRAMKPLPEFASLQEFEATVADVIAVRPDFLRLADLFRDRIERYDVQFMDRSARYHYSVHAPATQSVAALRIGERVRVWSDVGKSYTIYQLERDGEKLVSFDAEIERLRGDRRADLFLYIPVLLAVAGLSFWTIGRLHYSRGTRWRKTSL